MSPLTAIAGIALIALLWVETTGAASECVACAWAEQSTNISTSAADDPTVGLAFIHFKKAAGTQFKALISQWMVDSGCADKAFLRANIYSGINDGAAIGTSYTSDCSRLSFRHQEERCVSGLLVQSLPPRTERKAPFVLYTIMREPVERIGSLAFYSGFAIGHIVTTVFDRCLEPQSLDKKANTMAVILHCRNGRTLDYGAEVCACVLQAEADALEVIRTDEQLWFRWFRESKTYGPHYCRNYFLSRLVNAPNTGDFDQRKQEIQRASECMQSHMQSCVDVTNLMNSLTNPLFKTCDPLISTDAALSLAKSILRTHFDFLILEMMGEPASANALAQILGMPPHEAASLLKIHINLSRNRKLHDRVLKSIHIEGRCQLRWCSSWKRTTQRISNCTISLLCCFKKEQPLRVGMHQSRDNAV